MSKKKLSRSSARELEEFEEVVGGQSIGSEVHGAYPVVTVRTALSFKLPSTAARLLANVKVGDYVALIRTNDEENPIRIKRTETPLNLAQQAVSSALQ